MAKRTIGLNKTVIVFISCALVLLLLILSITGVLRIPFIDTAVQLVFVPVQKFATKTIQNTQSYFEDMAYQQKLDDAYLLLQEENKELKLALNEMEELRRENQRLMALSGRASEYGEKDTLLAKVVAMTPGNWFSSFTIDVGTKDGVKKNDPVINTQGLVGRVIEVYDSYCIVMSVVDGRSAVSGLIERTRDNGVVRGNLYLSEQDEACRMVYLPKEAELQPGDRVLSSGLDGIYPKGLLIGLVKDISREQGADHYVVVVPVVSFQHLEEVIVLRQSATGQEAQP